MSKYSDRFIYYDRYKKGVLFFISSQVSFVFVINMIQFLNLSYSSKAVEYISIGIIVGLTFAISHFVSKRMCYYEGSFSIENRQAIIRLKNKVHEISREDVKKIKFKFIKGRKGISGYYYFKAIYGDKNVCKIRLPEDEVNGNIEKTSLFRVYQFLCGQKK